LDNPLPQTREKPPNPKPMMTRPCEIALNRKLREMDRMAMAIATSAEREVFVTDAIAAKTSRP
jgi:hypothetical protein